MKISDIVPDLRVPWLSLPEGSAERRFSNGTVSLRSDATGLPSTRTLLDDTLRVSVTTSADLTADQFLESAVGELAEAIPLGGPLSATLSLVLVLALWDEEFRASGLFAGNIYLASERAVPALADAAGLDCPDLHSPQTLDRLLGELFQAELIYRFPVAVKFRGVFGKERQFRLNCWGRRLVAQLECHPATVNLAASVRAGIRAHLDQHRAAYQEHMALLAELAAHPAGTAWNSAERLPVGILF
ncbi:hypothetical protein [Kitasatospora sp. McL0602]|uniref:hypothetical protein n=1 Tax=Kitasatospora sp. McL0602 TaxID=3439530 RepID=UPI003F8BE686